jgi:hypothetical protein
MLAREKVRPKGVKFTGEGSKVDIFECGLNLPSQENSKSQEEKQQQPPD